MLLTLALVFTLLAPIGAASAMEDSPKTLVVLGDSIAYGYGVTAEQTYGAIIAAEYGLVLENYAVGGWRTADVINQLQNDEDARDAVANANAIQIAIGGNDMQEDGRVGPSVAAMNRGDNSLWEAQVAEIAARFAIIVDLVRELNPDAPFFVFNSYTPNYKALANGNALLSTIMILGAMGVSISGNNLFNLAQNRAIPYFNATYEAYLEENPGAFILVDIFDAFPGNHNSYYSMLPENFLGFISVPDILHPSPLGHQMLAGRLSAAINEYNKENMVAVPSAVVDRLNGNMNLLTVSVAEIFPLAPTEVFKLEVMIRNNAADYYEVGKYTVFVDTKGNTQIREIYIAHINNLAA
jgi:lysophospholipase L1-like esterase